MKILMVAAEFAPYAKTGGLGDATAGLCGALSEQGHDVRLLIPRYAGFAGQATVTVHRSRPTQPVAIVEMSELAAGTRIYLARHPDLAKEKSIYTGDDRDALRFIALTSATLTLLDKIDWQPDVVHCHDWHAAIVPAALRNRVRKNPQAASIPSVLTLHNIGYQGIFSLTDLKKHGIAEVIDIADLATTPDGGAGNFLRTGIRTAQAITTVSPSYAREIQTPEFGMGLEKDIAKRQKSLTGILNGVDYSVWDPAVDPYLDSHYDEPCSEPKARISDALRAQFGLEQGSDAPLVGIVSRLAEQKGIDLFVAALPTLLQQTKASFIVLGSGDEATVGELVEAASTYPTRVAFIEGYDEPLAHRIIAGSDLFLVPSRYEPCGLTQLYAMRYGTVPVVREVGGLADTVSHFDPARGTGNGSVFRHADADSLIWAIKAAIAWRETPVAWRKLIENGMASDYSWAHCVPSYENLYASLVSD